MSKINKTKITFNYSKADNYRNYHIDGVYGGVLPTGSIWLDVFIEKGLVPNTIISEIDLLTGLVNDLEKSPDNSGQLLRELQCGFVLNVATAKVLRDWLDDKIKTIDNAEQQNSKKGE